MLPHLVLTPRCTKFDVLLQKAVGLFVISAMTHNPGHSFVKRNSDVLQCLAPGHQHLVPIMFVHDILHAELFCHKYNGDQCSSTKQSTRLRTPSFWAPVIDFTLMAGGRAPCVSPLRLVAISCTVRADATHSLLASVRRVTTSAAILFDT